MNPDIEKHLQGILSTLNEVNVDHQSETQFRKQFLSEIHQQEQKIAGQTVEEILNQTDQYPSIRQLFEYKLEEQNKPLIDQLEHYPKFHFAISFVENIFDAIDNYQRLPQLLKYLIYKIRLPLLRLIVIKPELIIQTKLPAIELINEIIAYLVIWKDEKSFGYPTYTKLSQIIIFHTCNDESLEPLFKNLITPIHTIREEQQKRSLVFEKRLKDTEQSTELKSSAKILVVSLLNEINNSYNLIPLTAELFESSWRQLLELDILRNDKDSFYSHLVTFIMLVKSTQPINSKQQLDWLIDHIEIINQEINHILDTIGTISNKYQQLTSQLELIHIDLIEKNSHFNQPSHEHNSGGINSKSEQILRLKPSNVFASMAEQDKEVIEDGSSPDIELIEDNAQPITELINLHLQSTNSKPSQFPSLEKLVNQYSLMDKTSLKTSLENINTYSIQLGNWFLFEGEEELQKLIFINQHTGDYIFVNQNGQKSHSIPAQELISELNNKKIQRFKSPNLHKKAVKATLVNIKKYLSDFHSKKPGDKILEPLIDVESQLNANPVDTELLPNETDITDKVLEPKEIETALIKEGKDDISQDELSEPNLSKNKVPFNLQQLSVGSWLNINHKSTLIKCKMAARIASKNRYIFVDRAGKKLLELSSDEIMQYYNNDLLELITIETNNESSLADVISKTRHLKNVIR